MTPEEMNERMEFIARILAKLKAEDQMRLQEQPEQPKVVESRKTMKDLHDRLEKLLDHERQKLKDYDDFLRRREESQ